MRSGLWAAATSMAAAVLGSRGGGSRGRRRHQAQIDEKPSVRGRAKEEVIWGPFVPGEATTRDKRGFCPGWWLHPGQKAPPIYFLASSLLRPSSLPPSVPLLPPPLELPEHRRRRRRRPEPRRASPRHRAPSSLRAPPPLTSAALVFAAPGLHSARALVY